MECIHVWRGAKSPGCKSQLFTGSTVGNSLSRAGRAWQIVVISILLVLFSGVSIVGAAPPMELHAKGRILVQARAGLPQAQFKKALAKHGGRSIGRFSQTNLHIVSLPPQANEKAVARALSHNPHILFAEVDQLVPLSELSANDPYYIKAWHLPIIQAPEAWSFSFGDGVVVAILDTGVDPDHTDLMQQLVPGWNVYDNNSDSSDVYGHGTKVAGTAAAVSNNGIGVTSIAWNAQIMPVRISRPDGYAYWSTIANGILWAADHGARIANVSYAASGSYSVQSAADYFKSKGGLVFISAGNTGSYDSTVPSDSVISVAATTSSDTRASWSTYGDFVDVSAPGAGIWTTVNGGGYSSVSGTSFSSPAAAGVAALVMAANPALQPSQIESILKSTAVDLGSAGFDVYYGYGRVNAGAAVLAASETTASDTQAPSVSILSPQEGEAAGVIPVDVTAEDNVGITRVDLFEGSTWIARSTTAPYAFSWDTTTMPDGPASLLACAEDAAGNSSCSKSVSITVNNVPDPVVDPDPVDATPPSVTILKIKDGGTISGTTKINVLAADDGGISSIELYVDGTLVTATINSTTLSYAWNTRKASRGWYTIEAVATDNAGNKGTCSVQVYVNNAK